MCKRVCERVCERGYVRVVCEIVLPEYSEAAKGPP